MKKIRIILSLLMLLTITLGYSQNGWNWGDQPDVAKEKNVLYSDAMKAKNYTEAIPPLSWLLENTPDLNASIYINGVKIYEELAKKEADPAKKDEYIQKGIELFDKRIEIYPEDKADITDRKAIFAYKFYSKDKEKYEFLYNLYKDAFDLNGKQMNSGNLVAYMNMVYKFRFAGGDLSDDVVIETYSDIVEALEDQKERVGEDRKARYDRYLSNVDKLLTATKVEISCEWVEDRLGPQLEETGDLNLAKKTFKLLIDGKCLDRPLALKAAQIVQDNEPTFAVAKFLAGKNGNEGNTEQAIKFYQEAADLTDESLEKAEMYVNIANIQRQNGDQVAARNSARRALSYDPSFSDAYTLIGDLYYNSWGKGPCFNQVSQVEDRAVFIAAYDQYKQAGNQSKMEAAKSQFPSIEDIFNEGKEEGQAITIGCWINTTVKLERRPAN
jgi:tetratricopeptide (TPR) repeat protein